MFMLLTLIQPYRDISETIPGSFMADNKEGKRVSLTSFGMLAVELESLTGETLQIAPGNTATLSIPIPPSIASSRAFIDQFMVYE